jgi:glucokinase
LVTVSTGIGARLYDYHRQAIPVDAVNGIQGEIGHIPVEAVFRGRRISYRCDCGGESHLNACSSGRAIGSLLRELPHLAFETLNGSALGSAYCSGDETDESRHTTFRSAVAAGDALALEVLDFLTRPLARMFATILTHDPLVDAIVLTGGVVDALGSRYVESLNQQFIEYDMFQVTKADPNYLRRRLRVAPPDDQGGLIGAGYIALAAASGRKIYAFV